MRRLLIWALSIGLIIVILVVGLLIPVAYVELACQSTMVAKRNHSIISDQHLRAQTRTLMTYPEWHIVHAYEDYAEVINKRAPHDFNYWNSVKGYWTSLCSLTKASGSLGKVDIKTKQMVYIIGTSFTLELILKALYEESFGRMFVWLRGPKQSHLDKVSAKQARKYAEFLQQVPWYKWDFNRSATELTETPSTFIRDRERRTALGLEYRTKAAYAGIIAQAVANAGADQLTLRMVISGEDVDQTLAKLESYKSVNVIVSNNTGTIIETPRYRELTLLLQKLASDGLNFVEIAGNDKIMFTVLSPTSERQNKIASMKRQGFNDYRHLVLLPVSDLAKALRNLASTTERLEHIHDY